MILRARYVLAADLSIIDRGAVRIADGRIVEVGSDAETDDRDVIELGDCILVPGFVNAHTHLELTHLAGRVPPRGDFFGWIGRLVDQMQAGADDPGGIAESVRRGRELSLTAGVTTLGDITRRPNLTRPVLAAGPLRVVSFGEVIAIGKLRDRLASRLAAAADRTFASPWLQVGVSPHAPYTLEPDGLRACAKRARDGGLPLSMHLAESAEEALFTASATGPLRDHLERRDLWDHRIPCPGMSPVELAASSGILAPTSVLAHVNHVTDCDLDRLAVSGAHVAYCPRTHQAFGHPPHRFVEMLDRGINVCIATDSLASNPSLSVLDELRFLRGRYPELPGELLLAMGTVNGARALGLDGRLGSIAPGMQADLTVIPLDPQGPADPLENILVGSQQPSATYVAGGCVKQS